jgi:EAL domain-containing protein (putative c-di-GMP-specific phosphodiesterase class I)
VQPGGFVVSRCPTFSLADGSIAGVETLARWKRPGRGLLAPGEFIPVAEESSLIAPFDAEATDLRLAVNLSRARHRRREWSTWSPTGRGERAQTAMPRDRNHRGHDDGVGDALEQLRDLGVRLVINDFGTGYSRSPTSRDSARRL